MLVTLGTNQTISANSSATYTYSPDSVQRVLLRVADSDWETAKITVQIGSTTICNGASAWGLAGLSSLRSNINSDKTSGSVLIDMDFGSHVCVGNDNLYVTISTDANAQSAVDISALVDEPGANFPLKLTEYSDNTFTSENNLFALCFDAAFAAVEDDYTVCTIKTSLDSSAPTFCSAASWFQSENFAANSRTNYGILNKHQVPLKTTYNYVTDVVDRILTVEQMPSSRQQIAQAKQSKKIALDMAGK